MVKDVDVKLTCRECGRQFLFTTAEQEFYELQGFTSPRRCRECRSTKQEQPHHLVCSQCETGLEKGASVYCSTCLANVQLEFELKTKQSQKSAKVAHAKLETAESEKAELEELLRRREQQIAELEQKFDSLSRDLEKAVQFQAALGWLEPALNGMGKRLEALEQAQNKTNERMLQIVERMHEMYENTGLMEVIKRSLKRYQREGIQPTQG